MVRYAARLWAAQDLVQPVRTLGTRRRVWEGVFAWLSEAGGLLLDSTPVKTQRAAAGEKEGAAPDDRMVTVRAHDQNPCGG